MTAGAVVHLACGEVAALLREAPEPAQWLSDSEMERLAAIRTPPRRAQFLAARWQARWLLAQVLGGRPGDWALDAPRDAPPRVRVRQDLCLSISHSAAFTACALAGAPVGLDLEQPRRRRDIAGLIELVCTPREQAMFTALPEPTREALFYELWTVKEAWLKRRVEWIAPARLAQVEARRRSDGELRTWRGEHWQLAVTAGEPRWWSPQPRAGQAWAVLDLSAGA